MKRRYIKCMHLYLYLYVSILDFIGAKRMMDVVVTTADVQSSSQIITTNKSTPNFLQAGCPSCCPTNSVKSQSTERKICTHYLSTYLKTGNWGTGIRRLTRGMATLPRGYQELLVVRDKLEDPQVSLE